MSKYKEILAPVGNWEMLYAAVCAGADAVYLGGKLFSARTSADNFSIGEIREIVRYCHLENVKVYITLNTLLKDHEIKDAFLYAQKLYLADVDALIIQDLGLAHLLRKMLPDWELHASTQMNINSLYGAKLLKELGFHRVVLARETSLSEIKKIKEQVDIDIEVFVHGSLCVSQSGQCFMSSMIGVRSGNRGRCAQPCRKVYDLYDDQNKLITENLSLLSPKDLNTIDDTDTIKDCIDSFKIEGRMKKKEYVFAVVNAYKNKLSKTKDTSYLEEVKNRGYTKGLLLGDFGKSYTELHRETNLKGKKIGIITKERKLLLSDDIAQKDHLVFETEKGKKQPLTVMRDAKKGEILSIKYLYDAKILSAVHRVRSESLKVLSETKKVTRYPISIGFVARIGEKAEIHCENITVFSDSIVEEALKNPLTSEIVEQQFQKLGDTNFVLDKFQARIFGNCFLTKRELNQMRRSLVEKLILQRTSYFRNVNLNEIYEHEKLVEFKKPIENSFEKRYEMPRFMDSIKYEKLKPVICQQEEISFHNIGDLQYLKENVPTKRLIADSGLNVMNRYSADCLLALGVHQIVSSLELNKEELFQLVDFVDADFEVIIKDEIVDMIIINCPVASVVSCDRNCALCNYQKTILKYQKERYVMRREESYTEIINPKHLDLMEYLQEMKKHSIKYFRIRDKEYKTRPFKGHMNRGIL